MLPLVKQYIYVVKQRGNLASCVMLCIWIAGYVTE